MSDIEFVSGGLAEGGFMQLSFTPRDPDDEQILVRLKIEDIPKLIGLLLMLSIDAMDGAEAPTNPKQALPLPIRHASVSETQDGENLLVFQVGNTPLGFILPPAGLAEIGQALLLMSAERRTLQPS